MTRNDHTLRGYGQCGREKKRFYTVLYWHTRLKLPLSIARVLLSYYVFVGHITGQSVIIIFYSLYKILCYHRQNDVITVAMQFHPTGIYLSLVVRCDKVFLFGLFRIKKI